MIRPIHWLTVGLTSTLLFTVGCSSSTAPVDSPQSTASPAAEADAAVGTEADAETDAEAGTKEASQPAGGVPAFRKGENITLPAGADPLAIVFAARQTVAAEPIGSEGIRVAYPNPDKAIVTITKTGLADDSVAATRTRYDFKPVAGAAEGAKQWQLVQVLEQNKCQKDRGPQDWTGEVCK